MPFQEVSKMHLRKQMVLRVRSGELTVSGAAREYGVSRNTVKLWIAREREGSLTEFAERSRRPVRIPRKTVDEVEGMLVDLKAARPNWGAKKLLVKLWPEGAPISLRTADRILKRHDLVKPRGEVPLVQRFEREGANELWQIDFKGLGLHNPGYSPLTVLDDASRFCIGFDPLENHRPTVIFRSLWIAFGEYGLPDAILMDNEPCFAEISRCGPSWLESQLLLLGIRALHGRPYHPQTQGKVERFHRTVQLELGRALRQPTICEARKVYSQYLLDYNYERPHEALEMKVPGEVYKPSPKRRPDRMPAHEIPNGSLTRKVQERGLISYRCVEYRVGRGLAGQDVELREHPDGMAVYFAGKRLGALEAMRA
jgi:transposase InsO family protein